MVPHPAYAQFHHYREGLERELRRVLNRMDILPPYRFEIIKNPITDETLVHIMLVSKKGDAVVFTDKLDEFPSEKFIAEVALTIA